MGLYINVDSKGNALGSSYAQKCSALEADGAVTIVPSVMTFQEGLVCVVDNGMFAAAAYAYSEREMEEFLQTNGRQSRWFVYKHAKEVAK